MTFSLMLDILVAILLVVTIVYAVVLNRRLGMLRRDKAELERLATTFGDSTRRAEESIGRLKSSADSLQGEMDKAQSLRDDLAFLIERGGSAADRLEELVRAARKETGPPAPKQAAAQGQADEAPAASAKQGGGQAAAGNERGTAAAGGADDFEGRSEAEKELLKALQSAR